MQWVTLLTVVPLLHQWAHHASLRPSMTFLLCLLPPCKWARTPSNSDLLFSVILNERKRGKALGGTHPHRRPPFMTHCIFLLCGETVESACHVENWLTALIKTSGFLPSQFPPPKRVNHLGPDSRTECSSCYALQSLQTTRQTLNRTGSSHQRKLSFPLAQPPPCWTLVLCEPASCFPSPSLFPCLGELFPMLCKRFHN